MINFYSLLLTTLTLYAILCIVWVIVVHIPSLILPRERQEERRIIFKLAKSGRKIVLKPLTEAPVVEAPKTQDKAELPVKPKDSRRKSVASVFTTASEPTSPRPKKARRASLFSLAPTAPLVQRFRRMSAPAALAVPSIHPPPAPVAAPRASTPSPSPKDHVVRRKCAASDLRSLSRSYAQPTEKTPIKSEAATTGRERAASSASTLVPPPSRTSQHSPKSKSKSRARTRTDWDLETGVVTTFTTAVSRGDVATKSRKSVILTSWMKKTLRVKTKA